MTLDLLKEAGYRYVMDWAVDDQPIWMRTRAGPILSVPYPIEINDSPALVYPPPHRPAIRRDGRSTSSTRCSSSRSKYPLVFAVALHPFIIGQPFRLRAFRRAVRHIMAHRDELWITTPGEIARYCESLPTGHRAGELIRITVMRNAGAATKRGPRRPLRR